MSAIGRSGHTSPRLRMFALEVKRSLLAQSEHSAKGANRTAQSQVGSGRCAASSAERFRPAVRFLGAFRRFFTGLNTLARLGGEGGTRLMFLSRLTKASAISGMSEGPSSGGVCIVASIRSA